MLEQTDGTMETLHKKTQPPLTVLLYQLGLFPLVNALIYVDIRGGWVFLCNSFHGAAHLFEHRLLLIIYF